MKQYIISFICTITIICALVESSESAEQQAYRKPSVEESRWSVGAVAGKMSGNTLYHISLYEGPYGIESELEFPLNSMMGGISAEYASVNHRNQREWKLRATILKNLGSASGVLKDSDWATDSVDSLPPPDGVGVPHPGLDIYSESTIDLDALTFDLTAIFNTIRNDNINIGPLIRFLYQRFHFIASNTNQVGYGPYNTPTYTGYIPGNTLDYEVTYSILAFGVNCEYPAYKTFRANLQLAYSPWAQAEDVDDHLRRYKRSTGSAYGTAFLALFGLSWDLKPNVTLTIGGEYRKIRTTGTQLQYFYAGPDQGQSIPVSDRIDSTQTFLSAMLTFSFMP